MKTMSPLETNLDVGITLRKKSGNDLLYYYPMNRDIDVALTVSDDPDVTTLQDKLVEIDDTFTLNDAKTSSIEQSITDINDNHDAVNLESLKTHLVDSTDMSVSVDETGELISITHKNSIISGTTGHSSGTVAPGDSFNIPVVTYDEHGHVTGSDVAVITLSKSGNYDLQEASADLLGGIKLGNHMSMTNGALTLDYASTDKYGLTKLTDTITETASSAIATTEKAVYDAIESAKTYASQQAQSVFSSIMGGATAEELDTIHEIAEAITNLGSTADGLLEKINKKADDDHTHNYAGAATPGGDASTVVTAEDITTEMNLVAVDPTSPNALKRNSLVKVNGGNVTATTFTGNLVGNVTGEVSGNAGTASKLKSAVTIGLSGAATGTATSFDGGSNITIPVTSLNASKLSGVASVNTTGNAGTATKLAKGVTITVGGTGKTFDGSSAVSFSLSEIGASAEGHTHSVASTTANGFMSTDMVSKLNGIATGANAYSHPTSSGNKHIPSGGSSGQILRWSADGTAVWGDDKDTWRGIQNNLTSDSTTDSLSAAQGKVLNSNLDTLEFGEVAGGKNLFVAKHDGYYSTNGKISSSITARTEYECSDIIKFNGSKIYISTDKAYPSLSDGKGAWFGIVCFDSNKNFISESYSSSYMGSGLKYNFSLPSGVCYVGMSSMKGVNVCFSEKEIDYTPYIPSVKMLAEENAQQDIEAIDLKMLGWTVPKECPIQNYVDSDGVFHQKVGRVDLGSLDWRYETRPNRFNANFSSVKFVDNITPIAAHSTKYDIYSFNTALRKDKAISVYGSNGIASILVVLDSSYTDATTFKNAMQGVYLYYELATEKTISVDGNEAVTKVNEDVAVLKNDLSEKAPSNHTHNYAGSSSAGGAANSAIIWDGYTQDINTLNTSDTWLLVAKDLKIQHRLATDFATASHTHSYIPLSGSSSITGNLEFSNSGTTSRGVIGTIGDNDYWRIIGGATASNSGYLEIATSDDGSEPIYVRQYSSGKFGTLARTAALLDGSGNTSFPGTLTIGGKATMKYDSTNECINFVFA